MEKPIPASNPESQEDLKSILDACLDSPAYVVFAAYLTPKKNEDGSSVIEFQYRRYHFAIEDTKQSIQQLSKFVNDDIQKLISQGEENF